MPDSISLHGSLSSDWSNNYKKKSFIRRRQAFLDLLSSLPADYTRTLDLGCGSGDLSSCVMDLFAPASLTCVDGSAEMLNYARLAHACQDNVDFILSPDFLFLANNRLDFTLVYSSSVLEYVRDVRFLIANVYSNLLPQSYFVFSLPNQFSYLRLLFIVKKFFFNCFARSTKSPTSLDYLNYSVHFSSAAESLFDRRKFRLVSTFVFDPFLPSFMQVGLFNPFFAMTFFVYQRI